VCSGHTGLHTGSAQILICRALLRIRRSLFRVYRILLLVCILITRGGFTAGRRVLTRELPRKNASTRTFGGHTGLFWRHMGTLCGFGYVGLFCGYTGFFAGVHTDYAAGFAAHRCVNTHIFCGHTGLFCGHTGPVCGF